ncbi:MAG: aminopeptidase P family N-terminal domain-containing protein [Acidobacteria bacterium]|nr:aminopeptidase P family N-terminal domain-containing protein [Acidobacteriota bacterium]
MPLSSGISRRNFLAVSGAVLGASHLAAHAGTTPPSSSAIESLPILSAQSRPFTNVERQTRIEHARELMTQNKIDAIILANSTSSSVYFANLHLYGGERLWALVLPARSKSFLVCPAFEEGRAHELLLPALSRTIATSSPGKKTKALSLFSVAA